MQISELITTLHHEVAKSYAFIAETKSSEDSETSVLHINIERMEIELPVTLSQQETEFNPESIKGLPIAFKRLSVPLTPQKGGVGVIPKKRIKGKTIMADIVGPTEKIGDLISPESVGRIKIVFKLIIS